MNGTIFQNTFGRPEEGTAAHLIDLGLDGVSFLEAFQREVGGGVFLDGMFSVTSRREVGLFLEPWLRLVPEGSRHFATTGFGDLLFHVPEAQIVRLRTQYGDIVAVPVPADGFFDWITEPRPMSEVLNYPLWDARCASLASDEVLSFTPALALGGSASWETLAPVKLREYLGVSASIVLKAGG
jgi:hypothetical protein